MIGFVCGTNGGCLAGVVGNHVFGTGYFDGVCVNGFGVFEIFGADDVDLLYPFTNLRLLLGLVTGIDGGCGLLAGVIENCEAECLAGVCVALECGVGIWCFPGINGGGDVNSCLNGGLENF